MLLAKRNASPRRTGILCGFVIRCKFEGLEEVALIHASRSSKVVRVESGRLM